MFNRTRRKAITTISIATLGLVLGIALITYGLVMGTQERQLRAEFQTFDENAYVTMTVEWVGARFAETDDGDYGYYWVTANGKTAIVESSAETEPLLRNWSRSAENGKLSEKLDGVILESESALKGLALRTYMQMYPTLSASEDSNQIKYFISTGRNADNWSRYLPVFGGVLLLISLIYLIIGIFRMRSVNKVRDALQRKLPANFDLNRLESEANIKIPELKFFVYENLLVSEASGLTLIDLNEVSWAYVSTYSSRGNQITSLVTKLKNKKNKGISLPAKRNVVDSWIVPLWQYLSARFPYILLGYTPENVEIEKERPKETLS